MTKTQALVIEPRKEHYRQIGTVIRVEDNPGSNLCSQYILMNFNEPYNYWFMDSEVKFVGGYVEFDDLVNKDSV